MAILERILLHNQIRIDGETHCTVDTHALQLEELMTSVGHVAWPLAFGLDQKRWQVTQKASCTHTDYVSGGE